MCVMRTMSLVCFVATLTSACSMYSEPLPRLGLPGQPPPAQGFPAPPPAGMPEASPPAGQQPPPAPPTNPTAGH